MSTIHAFYSPAAVKTNSGITRNPLVHAAIRFLPSKMKRIIYLSSAAAVANKQQDLGEQQLLRKLNQVLNLSTTGEAALALPMYLSHLIWTDKQYYQPAINQLKNCDLDDPNATACAVRMGMAMPEWLSYGSIDVIANDLMALFTKDNRVFKNSEFVQTQAH